MKHLIPPFEVCCFALVILLTSITSATAASLCRAVFDSPPAPINACADSKRVKLALVGDVLLHSQLQRQGYSLGFTSIWGAVEPFLRLADVAYANFEGTAAAGLLPGGRQGLDPGRVFDSRVYSSYPMFNYHPSVIDELKVAGFDIVSTANNHSLDRAARGIDATIDALADRKMLFTGTIKRGAKRSFITTTETPLGLIAWISCTYSTNGVPDKNHQVLMCFSQTPELLKEIRRAAAMRGVMGVIVVPHWGNEYTKRQNAQQANLGRLLARSGAMAIVGTHTHTVQPWEIVSGQNAMRVPVIHSTGNFVSGQTSLARETGMLAWLELCNAAPVQDIGQSLLQSSRLVVASAGWVPLRMVQRNGLRKLVTVGSEGPAGKVMAAQKLIAELVPDFDMGARLICGNNKSSTATKILPNWVVPLQ